jgi:hypothetical protein
LRWVGGIVACAKIGPGGQARRLSSRKLAEIGVRVIWQVIEKYSGGEITDHADPAGHKGDRVNT